MPSFCPRSQTERARFRFAYPCSAALLGALSLSAPSAVHAQEVTSPTVVLTVEQAMRMLTEHPATKAQFEARARIAEGLARSEGVWSNPEITYQREAVPDQLDTQEEYLLLSQRFELSGRQGLLSDAGDYAAKAERIRIEADANALRAQFLGDFYEALYQQARVAVLDDWLARLQSILSAMEKRQAAGDVSGYDSARVAKEHASIRRSFELSLSDAEQAKRRLAALLNDDKRVSYQVVGTLAPVTEPAILVPDPGSLPQIEAYEYDADAAKARERANNRWWIPPLNLSGGAKRASISGTTRSGYALSAGIEIPLFDRNQGPRARSAGEAQLAETSRQREERLVAARVAALSGALERKVEELRGYATETQGPRADLLKSAEAAYFAGEFGVVELLDGYRTHYEDQLGQLELSWSARQAWLALAGIAGLPTAAPRENP